MKQRNTRTNIYQVSEVRRVAAHEAGVINRMIVGARREFRDIPEALAELDQLDKEATEGMRRKMRDALQGVAA